MLSSINHAFRVPANNSRLGFHYYPDTLHFRSTDLQTWLPELQALGSSWITLVAPPERAIPEFFLKELLSANVEPVLHFHLPLGVPIQSDTLELLFRNYARWGVQFVALFDRPNTRAVWPASSWAQSDLVERFLDIYLPLAESALQAGLIPVFPPLEPGGDYWDTAFLRASLRGIQRRGYSHLVESLVLGAYAWAGNRPLNWGSGGPERWPGARPYHTPLGVQDQQGFRIFDWYLTITHAELGRSLPLLLLKAGSQLGDQTDPDRPAIDQAAHMHRNLAIARLMSDERIGMEPGLADNEKPVQAAKTHKSGNFTDILSDPVPPQVLACNFWLLAADQGSPSASRAWFRYDGSTLPVVDALRRWVASSRIALEQEQGKSLPVDLPASAQNGGNATHPISHYLLLPVYEWGVNDWHLDIIRPLVKKHHPTVGFSLKEARLAKRVTVVGGVQAYPDETLEMLRQAGCTVERMTADGTIIAT